MLKRRKKVTKDIDKNGIEHINNQWLRNDNDVGFFSDLIDKPEGALYVWSRHEGLLYDMDEAIKWIRENDTFSP